MDDLANSSPSNSLHAWQCSPPRTAPKSQNGLNAVAGVSVLIKRGFIAPESDQLVLHIHDHQASPDAKPARCVEQKSRARLNPNRQAVSRLQVLGFSDFDGQRLITAMLNIGKGRGTQILQTSMRTLNPSAE